MSEADNITPPPAIQALHQATWFALCEGDRYSAMGRKAVANSFYNILPLLSAVRKAVLGEPQDVVPVPLPETLVGDTDPRDVEITRLRDALDHIARSCHQSRSQTVRIRWIEARANTALEGKPYARGQFRDIGEPRNGIAQFEKMQVEIRRMKAEQMPVRIPEPKPTAFGMEDFPSRAAWRERHAEHAGWNACREAMLAGLARQGVTSHE